MGNCNFKTEYENDNVAGITFYLLITLSSYKQEPFPVSLCDWQGRLRQSVESRKEEGEKAVCHEGNAQRENHSETQCQLSHERKEISDIAQTPVSCSRITKARDP